MFIAAGKQSPEGDPAAASSSLHVFNVAPNDRNDVDENGIPITRPQPARFRRVHTKSRSGCLTCKGRKVRCDEARPSCVNCTRRELGCKYATEAQDAPPKLKAVPISVPKSASPSTSTPSKRSDYNEQDSPGHIHKKTKITGYTEEPKLTLKRPDFSHEEDVNRNDLQRAQLFLMHHYDRVTSKTLMYEDTLWSLDVPTLAFQYDFVLHAVLTISAAHLRFLHDDSSYSTLELHHLSKSMSGLQEALSSPITIESSDAIFACSMLLVIQSWSWLDKDQNAFAFATDGLLPLNKGMMKVVMAIWEYGHQSIFKKVMDTDGQFGDLSWGLEYTHRWIELDALFPNDDLYAQAADDHDSPIEDSFESGQIATVNALRRLLRLIDIINIRPSQPFSEARAEQIAFRLSAWPVICSPNYVKAIQDENDKALVVLGYYYAAVSRWDMLEQRHKGWWVVRRSNYWTKAIVERLQGLPEYSACMAWPREIAAMLDEEASNGQEQQENYSIA